MADITEELSIIADEPKGRLVKQAIYDALVKINHEAEIRPPARREIPIGQALIDTGFVSDGWMVGHAELGELGFSGEIRNATESSGTYTGAVTSIYTSGAGRAFVVTFSDWDDSGSPPTLTDSSSTSVSWTQVDTFKATVSAQTAQGDAIICSMYPGVSFDVKSTFLTSESQLSGITSPSEGDIYVNVIDDEAYAYMSSEWVTIEAPRIALLEHQDKRITVWTAAVNGGNGLAVSATDSDNFDIGVFVIYGDDIAEADYRLCLRDQSSFYGVKRISISNRTYKGVVADTENLPSSDNTDGDMYYVTSAARYYIWDEDDWYQDRTVYDSSLDSKVYRDDVYISRSTKKIFMCFSMVPTTTRECFFIPNAAYRSDIDSVSCVTTNECRMSASYQKSSLGMFPVFNTVCDDQEYFFLRNGSLAVLPIEIGAREASNNDSTD
jgi:hypothetical protein